MTIKKLEGVRNEITFNALFLHYKIFTNCTAEDPEGLNDFWFESFNLTVI